MSRATERKADVITSADLPTMRDELRSQANNEIFSEAFRASCRGAIAAIDQARDEDEATHASLEAGLNAFVTAGAEELQRCKHLRCVLDQLAEAQNAVQMRVALVDLLPLLSESNLADVATLISTTLADIRPTWHHSTKHHTCQAGGSRRVFPRRLSC